MKYSQNRYFLYAVISALVIFICLRECGDPVVKKTLTTDTVYIKSADKWHTLPAVKVPVPYKVLQVFPGETDTIYIEQKIDTAVILADFFQKRFYTDTAGNDSVKIYYDLQVYQNRLQAIKLGYKWTAPTMLINVLQERQLLMVGIEGTTAGDLYIGAIVDTRKAMFGLAADPINRSIKAAAYYKIKLWKRR